MKTLIAAFLLATSLLATQMDPTKHHPVVVYSNSIIPGGATPKQVQALRQTNPIVRLAFRDFGDDLFYKTADQDMLVYVSYRKGNQVIYTKSRHLIPRGELLIADLVGHLARARCGNVLRVFIAPAQAYAKTPEPDLDLIAPESEVEVTDSGISLDENPVPYTVGIAAVPTECQPTDYSSGPTYYGGYTPFTPGGFFPPYSTPPSNTPPTSVPEPGGLLTLSVIGIVALKAGRDAKKK